jgi:hypothetical protein
MLELSKEVVGVLQYLLPGFLVGWVFYGLTSHQKPSQFERVVQALIFSISVQFLVTIERQTASFLTRWGTLGIWDKDAELITSFITALALGAVIAHCSNKDIIHTSLRKLGLSIRSAHSSEWYIAFCDTKRYVVLHLKDDRRLFGWPSMWPSDPEKGHFLITHPEWLGVAEEQNSPESMVINVSDVKWVEFAKPPGA